MFIGEFPEIGPSGPDRPRRHIEAQACLKTEAHALKPLLRWAGGKQWLANKLRLIIPDNIGTYYEPFFGGGSLFFAAHPKTAVLSDLNMRLMETYEAVRSKPEQIMAVLARWPNDETTYYRVRDKVFLSNVTRSAQFIYLNRTCWNGLYRVNRSGRFNVPFGNHGRPVFDPSHILNVSAALEGATLTTADFDDVVEHAGHGDFIYFDPPYVTNCRKIGFRQYTEPRFSWQDQQRLGETAVRLADKGCTVVVSNANYDPIVSLYPGFNHVALTRHSVLAADPQARRVTGELVLCSSIELITKLETS